MSGRTNTVYNTETVAHVYKALWTVEDIIRTSKSILETRPIYHKREGCHATSLRRFYRTAQRFGVREPVGGLEQNGQVVEADGDVGIIGPEARFVDGQRLARLPPVFPELRRAIGFHDFYFHR